MNLTATEREIPKAWKPKTVDELVGPAFAVGQIVARLCAKYRRLNASGGLLFYGPPGVGKSTLSRLALDIVGVDPFNRVGDDGKNGSTMGVDDVVHFHEKCRQPNLIGGYYGLRIDEVDKLSKPAQMAVLKLADDVAEGKTQPCIIAVSCNSDLDQLEPRFQSRFQPFHVDAPKAVDCLKLVSAWLPENHAMTFLEGTCGAKKNINTQSVDVRALLNDTTTQMEMA